jgi:DHA3 family multidrug efflux protein-like MFS transporter
MSKDTQPDDHSLSKVKVFHQVLANTLFTAVVNFTVWFAITFYAYIQTHSVFVTGMIAGLYLVATLLTGVWFGSLVDHHKKRSNMIGSTVASLAFYIASLALYLLTPESVFKDPYSPVLWVFITLLMLGVIAGNIRTIVMPTLVTILIPASRRDKANGLVGTVTGVSFLVTSVISGLLVAWNGMLSTLILALVVMVGSIIHLYFMKLPEKGIAHLEADGSKRKVDLKGTIKIVTGVPGLMAMILFSCFNNFLGGVFMALMDAYGLSMMSVQAWGLLWGALSGALIVGGLIVAKRGLGANPIRTLFLTNAILWAICILFPLHNSILPLALGMLFYMLLMPFIEASEQTVLQRVVPFERQGRVFGFAQSVEQAASPFTAFMIGPLTQFVVIPFMTVGLGAQAIGSWFGTGASRGIALVFVVAGLIGLAATLWAMRSRFYRALSHEYRTSPAITTEAAS